MDVNVAAVTAWAADRLVRVSVQGAVVVLVWIACSAALRIPASGRLVVDPVAVKRRRRG